MRVDKRFDEIMLNEAKQKIAEAFLELESGIRILEFKTMEKIEEKILRDLVKNKANQMKRELNQFIDSQVERIINEKVIQVHSYFQCLEGLEVK